MLHSLSNVVGFLKRPTNYSSFTYVFLSNFINNVIAFTITIYSSRCVPLSEFGILTLAISIIGVGSLVLNFGLGITLIKTYSENKNETIFNQYITFNVIQALLLIILSYFIKEGLIQLFPILNGYDRQVYLAIFSIAMMNIWTTIRGIDQAKGNHRSFAINTLLYAVFRLCFFFLAFMKKNFSLESFLIALYIGPLSILVLLNWMTGLFQVQSRVNFGFIISQLKYGRWLLISSVSYLLISRLPQLRLANLNLEGELAIYGSSLTFLGILIVVNDSIRTILLPKILSFNYENIKRFENRMLKLFFPYVITSLVVMLSFSIMINIFLSDKFGNSISCFLVQSIALIITMYIGFYNSLMHKIGRPYIDTAVNIFRMLLLYFTLDFVPSEAWYFSLTFASILVIGEVLSFYFVRRSLRKLILK